MSVPARTSARTTRRPLPDGECRLGDLAPGTRATIVAIDRGAGEETAGRLGDLGFTPGTVVEVVRRAPLRDPVIYRLKDYDICLRRAQAALVRASVVA